MNDKYQNHYDMSLSSSQNHQRGTYDSFDVSIDANPNRNINANNGSTKSTPKLQNLPNEIRPYIGVSSPGDSNVPTQGDVFSPKEENYQRSGQGFKIPYQIPEQAQYPVNSRNRLDLETEIFSFRRDGQQRSENPGSNQENRENQREIRSQREELELMNYRTSYERNRMWLTKMKKVYIFYLLNLLCLGLVIFNLSIAYASENIIFPEVEKINNQFQQKVILDIDLIGISQNCNDAYSPATMGTWPGYDNLCYCPFQSYPGECLVEDLSRKCKNIGKFEALPIQIWDGKKICLRKSEKTLLQYYETSNFVESYNGNFMCPNGLKKCIVSSNKNFICVGRFEFCPVTQIEVDDFKDSEKNKFKAQLLFEDKILVYDNQGTASTTYIDLFVDHQYCDSTDSNLKNKINQNYCHSTSDKTLLDSVREIEILNDNFKNNQSEYSSIESNDISMNLYVNPTTNLELCVFNNTFNPVILNAQLANWRGVKYILFMNSFFITTLFIINIIRVLMINYINQDTNGDSSLKRKREIYRIIGKTFAGSSVTVVTEVCIILYYIFWGYLLLNPDKLIAEKWVNMSCLPNQIKEEIVYMIAQLTKIETFNMVTMGPMILGCIMEALLSQYKLITEAYEQLRAEREEHRE